MLSAIVLMGAAVGFSLVQTPMYEASIKILVGQKQAASDPYNLAGDVQGLQQLTQTLAAVVNSRPVAEGVVQRLDLSISPEDVQDNLRVQQIPETQLIQVTYKDPSPTRAQSIANAVGTEFSKHISEISSENSGVTATVWEAATVAKVPTSPNFVLIVLVALMVGTTLGVALALLLEYLDASWHSPEEVERAFGIPVFGAIPAFKVASKIARFYRAQKKGMSNGTNGTSRSLVTALDPGNGASEAYRRLRTNLLYSRMDAPPKVVLVTSAGFHEGKSTTCANLSVVLAQAGKETLLVDCDLRRPILHKVFGLRNAWGIGSVLVGERSLQEVWIEALPKLKVITAGPIPPEPAAILSSRRFIKFLTDVKESFDYVLIDSPPVQEFSDPLILATQADGGLLVLDAQATSRVSFARTISSLEAVGAVVLGTVMNNLEAGDADKRDYYDYGGSHSS